MVDVLGCMLHRTSLCLTTLNKLVLNNFDASTQQQQPHAYRRCLYNIGYHKRTHPTQQTSSNGVSLRVQSIVQALEISGYLGRFGASL
jgi:hypothetical protein